MAQIISDGIDAHVGGLVRARRIEARLSKSDIAAVLGVPIGLVELYERGVYRLGASDLLRLAECFDVPITAFFQGYPRLRPKLSSVI